MALILKYTFGSKKGIKREKNQDRILTIDRDSYYLFIIFDGVSSYPHSYLFINEFKKRLKEKLRKIKISKSNLSKILYDVHIEVLSCGINGMSTMSVLFFNKLTKKNYFINIGDSRIYIFTNQFLEKVTIDDSLPGKKNIITKCLGLNTLTLNDFKINNIYFGYNFLICTDGFYELMENNLKEYFTTLNFRNFRNIEKKINLLQRRTNKDDSSYIIIKNEISV